EDASIYINGTKVTEFEGYTTDYQLKAMGRNGKGTLDPNSKNTIAVHCHQTEGGQYIDVGITLVSFGSPLPASERSIYDDEGRETFVPYPNPASDYIHVTADSERPVSVSVTNLSGVEMLARDEVNKKVNIGSLPSGIYLMKVESGDETFTYRFLKK
ncbi:MAG: T9SS type A sorting domain-containing protein, partial [Bacteroidota bacterium]